MSEIQQSTQALKQVFFTQIGLILLLVILAVVDLVSPSVDLGSFFFAVILGALGASISLLRRILAGKSQFVSKSENLKVLAILIPILYGTVLAGIAYLLFMSGILSGNGGEGLLTTNLFPNFVMSDSAACSGSLNLLGEFKCHNPDGVQNAGKLLVWCFIAGYSERWIIRILDQLENKSDEKESES